MTLNALRIGCPTLMIAAVLLTLPHAVEAQATSATPQSAHVTPGAGAPVATADPPAAPAPPAQPTPDAKAPPVVTAGPEGFGIASADGAFKLAIGGYLQLDARRYVADAENTALDGFELRRIRPIFTGTVYKFIDFRLAPDFGEGKTQLMDAYLDLRFAKGATLRAGKFKPFYGLERLQSASELRLVERGLATNLAPNRDYGVTLFGDVADTRLSYAIGFHNGTVDGANVDLDDNDGKDVIGRLFLRPAARSANRNLQTLGFGVAATFGPRRGTPASSSLPAYKTAGQQVFFRYRASTIVGDGNLARVSPQMNWAVGPIAMFVEHTTTRQDVRRLTDGATATVDVRAISVTVGCVLTGERASLRNVSPARPFNRAAGGWGALEVVARVDRQTLSDNAFPIYADPAVSAQRAQDWGLGLNWYLNRSLKLSSAFERTTFRRGGPDGGQRPPENAFLSRLQLVF